MKRPTTVLSFASLALGTLLSSCVDPYAGGYGPQATATTYRAGYEVRSLPPGYRTEVIGGTSYYNHNGTYYRPRSGRYVVVEAPRQRVDRYRHNGHTDVVVTKLPPGYRVVKHRGSQYYQVRDTYYQRRGTGYVVVTRPY
jgi:hypothetical protein